MQQSTTSPPVSPQAFPLDRRTSAGFCRSTINPHQPKRVLSVARKGKKEKTNSQKEFPENVFCWPNSSFGIDAQEDKRSSLRDWHPGCN
jgi:hypothetical protein